MLLTFHFVCFCWIFFRASTLEIVWQMLGQILFHFNFSIIFQFVAGYKIVLALMALGYVLHFLPKSFEVQFQQTVTRLPLMAKAVWITAIIVLVIQTKSAEIQPFIYFQF
jgi:hypothetical protein